MRRIVRFFHNLFCGCPKFDLSSDGTTVPLDRINDPQEIRRSRLTVLADELAWSHVEKMRLDSWKADPIAFAATLPYFSRLGLRIDEDGVPVILSPLGGKLTAGWDAVTTLFHINKEEAIWLFSGFSYNNPTDDETPVLVRRIVARIRSLC